MTSRIWFNREEAEGSFTEGGEPKLDFKDPVGVSRTQQANTREATIKYAELDVLESELWKCYYREGVNHIQKCQHLADAYVSRLQKHSSVIRNKPAAQ